MEEIRVGARAKINLFLKVLGERPDGYHDIETVFHSIDLADRLVLRPARSISVTCDHPGVPPGPHNLAARAASAILERTDLGLDIALRKEIPVGAGLGGGSADAAGVLVGANRLYRLGRSEEELQRIGGRLGADVPFLIRGGCAAGTGIGDRLSPLPALPALPVVLVRIPVSISTAWAYASLRMGLTSPEGPLSMVADCIRRGAYASFRHVLKNDFEGLVFERFPSIERIKNDLLGWGAVCALLTGSGPVVFGLFDKAGDARTCSRRLRDRGLEVIATHLAGHGVTAPE
jgi:4-diphosphocytidyl-2-C-methyl-D-erythritol kinase